MGDVATVRLQTNLLDPAASPPIGRASADDTLSGLAECADGRVEHTSVRERPLWKITSLRNGRMVSRVSL